MIKKTIDDIDYYCFEQSDDTSRTEFEKAMVSEDSVEVMVKALLEAVSKARIDKIRAWEQMQRKLIQEFPELEGYDFQYHWVQAAFTLKTEEDK